MESYNMGKCRSKKRPEEQTAMHFKNGKTYLTLDYFDVSQTNVFLN